MNSKKRNGVLIFLIFLAVQLKANALTQVKKINTTKTSSVKRSTLPSKVTPLPTKPISATKASKDRSFKNLLVSSRLTHSLSKKRRSKNYNVC